MNNFGHRVFLLLFSIYFVSVRFVHADIAIQISAKETSGAPLGVAQIILEENGRLLASVETDQAGVAKASIPDFSPNIAVTVWKRGYTAVTQVGVGHFDIEIILPKIHDENYAIHEGKLTGYDAPGSKTRAQIGIVTTSFSMSSIIELATAAFLSPAYDNTTIIIPLSIPSNIVLPDQWVNIGFVPVHLNKPKYRLPLEKKDLPRRLIGLSGNAEARQTLDAITGKDYETLFSELKVTRVALGPAIDSLDAELGTDLNANVFVDAQTTLKAEPRTEPTEQLNAALNTENYHLLLALWEFEAHEFIPTDVKPFRGTDMNLRMISAQRAHMRYMDLNVSANGRRFRSEWLNPEKDRVRKGPFGTTFSDFEDHGVPSIEILADEAFDHATYFVQNVKPDLYGRRLETALWNVSFAFSKRFSLPEHAYSFLRSELAGWNASSLELVRKTKDSEGQTDLRKYNEMDDVQVLYGISQPRY